jgi:hypothetical protein
MRLVAPESKRLVAPESKRAAASGTPGQKSPRSRPPSTARVTPVM